ncbi:MAG: flavodoxin domain-containing protein [bacterium]|nr:flavodoxin domain-containing protein [bacterium]
MDRRQFFASGLAGIGAAALAGNAGAMKFYPMPSDKKWAVLYATWCGSTRDAAAWISEGMGGIADVFDVRENPDLSAFTHIVIGGGIRMAAVSGELQDYLRKHRDVLKPRIAGLFAVCGNMGRPVGPEQKETLIDAHLAKLSGAALVPSHVFLGRVTKSLMDPETAKMMAAFDDYDNLKRPECMAFGAEVLAGIKK